MTDPVKIYNATAETIPSGGLCRVTGTTGSGGERALSVGKPDADDQAGVLVNGFATVPPGGYGSGSFDNRVAVAYDTRDGTPAAGEDWGVKSGCWEARKDYLGFRVLGGGGGGLVNAVRHTGSSSVSAWKEPCRVATTAAITLATGLEAGDTIDGVTLAAGDRVLVKDQSSAAENGIYVVAASGAPSRAADADAGSELVNAVVAVSAGTANADSIWMCTANATITVGSTSLPWVRIYPARDDSRSHVDLSTIYSITADNTDEDVTGMSVTLPAGGGVFLLYAQVTGEAEMSALPTGSSPAFIAADMYNSTAGSQVCSATVAVPVAVASRQVISTCTLVAIYFLSSAAGAHTIQLRARRYNPGGGAAGTWTTSNVESSIATYGGTHLGYYRLR